MPDNLAAATKKALRADEVTVTDVPGGQRVEATRGDARIKFDLFGDWANCVSLSSPGGGWLEAANALVTDVLAPDFGLKYVVMDPGSEAAAKTLTKYAPYKPTGAKGLYRWDV